MTLLILLIDLFNLIFFYYEHNMCIIKKILLISTDKSKIMQLQNLWYYHAVVPTKPAVEIHFYGVVDISVKNVSRLYPG